MNLVSCCAPLLGTRMGLRNDADMNCCCLLWETGTDVMEQCLQTRNEMLSRNCLVGDTLHDDACSC